MATATTTPKDTTVQQQGGQVGARKRAAVDFLQKVGAGSVREAYERYIAPSFVHHNPHFRSDADSLRAGMQENAAENPEKELEVLCAIGEGDLVAVHSRVRMDAKAPWFALAHIFRFEGEQVAELWDLAQEVPADSPNEHGMF